MAEQKYTDTEKFKRGIDRILKSDQYTDEYKQILMERLGNDYNVPKESITEDVDFDLSKDGGPVVTLSKDSGSLVNLNDKPAAVTGYLEKPDYIEDELTRAVDVDVDELISAPPKQKPETVPKDVYDDLRKQYNEAIDQIEDLRAQLNAKIEELESANATINLLNQTVDSEKLLRAAADNETQSSNERYRAVLKDFQTALQKGIQEAIERVSLTAQVRGLQAQKEVLQQQLESLKAITESLQGQIETQQLQIEAQQAEIQRQQEETAAIQLVQGRPGFFDATNETGWKVPDSNIGSQDTGAFQMYYDKHKGFWFHGNEIELYNLTEERVEVTIQYVKGVRKNVKGDNKTQPWITGEQRVYIDARSESDPGITPLAFSKKYIWRETGSSKFWNKSAYADDQIILTFSNGDKYTVDARYKLDK